MNPRELVNLVRHFWTAARGLWREPRGRWAFTIVLLALAVMELVLADLRHRYADAWFWGEVLLVPIAMLIVALGYAVRPDHSTDSNPSGEAFLLNQVNELLADKHDLLKSGRITDDDLRDALLELVPQLARPRHEGDYLGAVLATIRVSSIWAVCGRKGKLHAEDFWEANMASINRPDTDHPANGRYIERVFVPPRDEQEVEATKIAMTNHLSNGLNGILVRAFNAHRGPSSVFKAFGFPSGFGMTIMGASQPGPKLQRDPGQITEVLIHWGRLDDKNPHFGVILRSKAWAWHYFGLFRMLADGNTQIVNAEGNPPTKTKVFGWEQFIQRYSHYARVAAT